MDKYVLYIATNDAAEAYENGGFNEMKKAIEEDYADNLSKFEFKSKEEKRAFQDALEFCGETCGCGNFYVVGDDDVEAHPIICKRLAS